MGEQIGKDGFGGNRLLCMNVHALLFLGVRPWLSLLPGNNLGPIQGEKVRPGDAPLWLVADGLWMADE